MPESPKIQVTFFHRKQLPVGQYSLEFIFADVRERLKDRIEARVATSRYTSTGLYPRLYNAVEAALRQSKVNHVTGDINYVGLLLWPRRTIQTILDCVYLQSATGLKRRVLKLFWLTIPVRRARRVTAISASTRNEILKNTGCDPAKVVVIPVAISERFKRVDRPFRAAKPVILHLGTAPNKNIPRLIEALEGIPCTLRIIGHHNPAYEAMLRERKIDYEYRWGLTDGQVLEQYSEADIVTLVSTYEGFGMPIVEAQAVGRPVIAGNVYSMPEVAGDAACLVDPHDVSAIRSGFLRIINDAGYRDELVARGFENVKRFDPNLIAEQYLALYREVAGPQRRAN